MPMTKEMLKPHHNTKEERNKIEKTKDKQAYYYNQNLCPAKEIRKGVRVRIRKPTEDRCSLGKCIAEVAPRSFEIKVDEKYYRRNIKDIRFENTTEPENKVEDSKDVETDPLRRSNRIRKLPSKLQDNNYNL